MFGQLVKWFTRTTKALMTHQKDAMCGLCKRSYRVAGPFVEWQENHHLCEKCIIHCQAILDADKAQRGFIPDRSGQARKKASQQQVLYLIEEKRFGCLAKALNSSLHERLIERNEDAEDTVIVQSLLGTVVIHLEFLASNDETLESLGHEENLHQQSYDNYFQVWIGLGAFGIYQDILRDECSV